MTVFKEIFFSFVFGGFICAVGQIIMDRTKLTPGRILTFFVLTGVILGSLGIYEKFVSIAGAGATVPLTGFGYAMVKGTKEAILQKGALGIITGPLSSSSAGITTAVLCGLTASFFTKPKSK